MTEVARQANTGTLQRLVSTLHNQFVPDTTYLSNEAAQKHEIASCVPMQHILDMLTDYQLEEPRDTAAFTGLLVTLVEALRQDANLTAAVYRMRPTARLYRSINDDGTIDNFLQGRTDRTGGYPGDTFYQQPNQLSVQLHAYDLRQNGSTVAVFAPLLVFHVPSALARSWLIQVQNGQ